MAEGSRRFPAPWRSDKIPGGYVVRDADGQALAYLYSRDNPTEALQAKMLTPDEAQRIAINIARLPELLKKVSLTDQAMQRMSARSVYPQIAVVAVQNRTQFYVETSGHGPFR